MGHEVASILFSSRTLSRVIPISLSVALPMMIFTFLSILIFLPAVPGVLFSICFRADLRGRDRSSGYILDYYVGGKILIVVIVMEMMRLIRVIPMIVLLEWGFGLGL